MWNHHDASRRERVKSHVHSSDEYDFLLVHFKVFSALIDFCQNSVVICLETNFNI